MSRIQPASRPLVLLLALLLFGGAALDVPILGFDATPAAAADGDADAAAREKAARGLGKQLAKLARSKYLAKKLGDVREILDGLAAIEGPAAGLAALRGATIPDAKIRDRIFLFAEENHDAQMLKPLVALLESKDHRRDTGLQLKIIHTLAVLAEPKAIEPLSGLIRFDVDATVVAEICTALTVFSAAPIEQRKTLVKALINLYETTWTYRMSIRPEDKILTKRATKRWRIYAPQMRTALQTLTGRQWTKPKEWRRWWNDCKKARDWRKCKSKLDKLR